MPETANLDRALVTGMAWTAVMRWSSQIVSWIATFYVARILAPADYGIISMATVAIGFARLIEDFGLDSIFLQDRSIVGGQQSRLAGFVLLIGATLCLIFVALAEPIAAFFHEPRVVWAVCWLSILFITDSLQVVPRALMQRDLAFGKLAIVAFVQVAVTQTVLVLAARAGLGYKALVLNSLAGGVAVTLLLCYWRPYGIRWPRDIPTIARPLLQGWRVLASRIAYYGYAAADSTIIGRELGKDALGAYSFAQTLSTTAMQEVGSVVSKVVPGIFSATQSDRAELRRYYLLLTEMVAYLTFPMSIGLGITADLVVRVVLGPQWDAVVAPLRILCIYTAFSNSQLLVSHLMLWTGQFRAQMWCTIATTAVLPFAFMVGVRYGLVGIAWCWAVVYPLTNVPAIVFGFRTISISVRTWFGAVAPALLACAVMSAAVLGVRAATPETIPVIVRCAAAIGTGVVAYAAVLWFVYRARLQVLFDVVRHARRGDTAPATV